MDLHPDLLLSGILSVVILGLTVRVFRARSKQERIDPRWIPSIKYSGIFAAGLGVLLTLIELLSALGAINNSLTTTEQIAMGIQSTLYATMHGLIVYLLSLTMLGVLKWTEKTTK